MNDFTTTFTTERTPEQVYDVINDVRSWWTGDIDGTSDALGEDFSYRHEDIHYSKHKVVDLVPGRRVAWLVVEAKLSFAQDPEEWKGTEITFDLAPAGAGTRLTFTHRGLTPELDCFEGCSGGWRFYVDGSLRALLT